MEEKNIFTEDIKIPDIVLKKADAAFAAIRKEDSAAISTEYMDMTPKTRKRLFKSGWVLAACIALIASAASSRSSAFNSSMDAYSSKVTLISFWFISMKVSMQI